MQDLKDLFPKPTRVERYEISKKLFACKMVEGSSVSEHLYRITGYMRMLNTLGCPISQELSIDLILMSLPRSYSSVIMNYRVFGMGESMGELFDMLKIAEKYVDPVRMVNKTINFKRKGNSKGANKANTPRKSKAGATPDVECFFCKETGHWKRNCKKYLAEKKSEKSI